VSKRCRQALLAGLVVIAVGPAVFLLLCPHRADCIRATGQVAVSSAYSLVTSCRL